MKTRRHSSVVRTVLCLALCPLGVRVPAAEPNPLAAIDAEKIASQVAGSDSFCSEARQVFAGLSSSAQPEARRVIESMAGSQKMQAAGNPLDGLVARHLTGAISPLIQDADVKAVLGIYGDTGRLDLLLASCSASTKPTLAEQAQSRKLTPAEKKRIEKRLLSGPWSCADDHRTFFSFTRDGTVFRFGGPRPLTDPNGSAKWSILDDGTVWIPMKGHNYMITIPSEGEALYRDGKFDEKGRPVHGTQVPIKMDPDERLPRDFKPGR